MTVRPRAAPPGGQPPTPPGWYPDPWGQAPTRWFDGVQWTPSVGAPDGAPATVGPDADDAATRMLLPVGRTPLSIVAGYVAFLSILLVFAPVSLLLGILALRQLRSTPGRYGRGRAIFAIVMGAVFTVVLIAVLVHAAA